MIFLPEIVGDYNIGTYRDTEKQIYKYADYGAVAAYGGYSLTCGITAYYGYVNGIERLLEYAAGYQWQGKDKYFAEQRSVQHIHLP